MCVCIAEAVTRGPKHHFFGYYNIQPWDATGRYLLCLEVPFQNRPPQANDEATVGVVDLSSLEFIPLAQTMAWNFQQAAMMHWLPRSRGSEIVFNDRQGTGFVSVILNVDTRRRRVIPRPISAVSHDGKTALSLNFSRLQWARPGYGYPGVEDPFLGVTNPSEDGIYSINLESGESRRMVSLRDVMTVYPSSPGMKKRAVYFNHTLFNRDDTKFAFLVEWKHFHIPTWARVWRLRKLGRLRSGMFSAKVNGSDLHCVIDYGTVSHFDWRNPREILVWANVKGHGKRFYLVDEGTREYRPIGEGILTEDGHCSFSPDGRWVLTDTYPDKDQRSTLKVFDWQKGTELILGRYRIPPPYGELRCDLHPRWNRTGTQICFDSTHEGSQQLYVLDVSKLLKEDTGGSDTNVVTRDWLRTRSRQR